MNFNIGALENGMYDSIKRQLKVYKNKNILRVFNKFLHN